MIAELPATVEEFQEFVLQEMHELTSAGRTTTAAADAVLQVIRDRDLVRLYLDMVGSSPLVYYFGNSMRNARRPTTGGSSGSVRRIGTLLNPEDSVLEGEWPVGNQWVRLGDMTQPQTENTSSYYGRLAQSHAAKQAFFSKLGAPLKKGERVRDRWTEEAIIEIYPKD